MPAFIFTLSGKHPRCKIYMEKRTFPLLQLFFHTLLFKNINWTQSGPRQKIRKVVECLGQLSFIKIICAALFVSLNNRLIAFCCPFFMKISLLALQRKFKGNGREISLAEQTFQSRPKEYKRLQNEELRKTQEIVIHLYQCE